MRVRLRIPDVSAHIFVGIVNLDLAEFFRLSDDMSKSLAGTEDSAHHDIAEDLLV